jgi:hypothetical protein
VKQRYEARLTSLTDSLELERARRKYRQSARLRPTVFSILATLGIFGGISALFVGLVFVVIHGVLSGDVTFNRVGTGLLIVAIPMILLGSVFLDEIEGKK